MADTTGDPKGERIAPIISGRIHMGDAGTAEARRARFALDGPAPLPAVHPMAGRR